MSEYQYYHFQAIDRPLSQQQMHELRDVSTRAEITPTSFINTYNWGDLKADPLVLLRQYFDAHVYVANWGTHRFLLKVPRDLLDLDMLQAYCGECCHIYPEQQQAIIAFESNDDSGERYEEWDSGEGWMGSLLPLRDEIMRGDLRPFYVAWLAGVYDDDDLDAPPLPPGLRRLSGPQQHLAHFLGLDEYLLQAAMEQDTTPSPTEPSAQDMAAWVAALSAHEKDTLLLTLLTEDQAAPFLGSRLRQQFHKAWRQEHPQAAQADLTARRTVSALWQRRDALAEAEQRRQAEAAAKARAEQERQAAAQRKQYLADLASREGRAWQEVATCLATTQPKKYAEAVTLLGDLRELASARGELSDWQARITAFRRQYARKSSLMQRFTQAGFP